MLRTLPLYALLALGAAAPAAAQIRSAAAPPAPPAAARPALPAALAPEPRALPPLPAPLGPQAADYLRSYQRNQLASRVLAGVGAAIVVGSFLDYSGDRGGFGMSGSGTATLALGTGVALMGLHRHTVAQRALELARARAGVQHSASP